MPRQTSLYLPVNQAQSQTNDSGNCSGNRDSLMGREVVVGGGHKSQREYFMSFSGSNTGNVWYGTVLCGPVKNFR